MVLEANRVDRLVVHIGAHKTGTTSIQQFSYRNTDFLAERGVYYPANLLSDYPEQHSSFRFLYRDGRQKDVVDAIRQTWRAARDKRCDVTFLSGEEFCNLSRRDIRHFAGIARRYYRNLIFVYVVRNRRQYILSQYKHFMHYASDKSELSFLKTHQPPSPGEVISRWKARFSDDYRIVNYNAIEAHFVPAFYREVFGVEITENRRENYSLDMLTLQIYNTFLKDLKGSEVERIVWEFINEHPVNGVFPIEVELADELSVRFPIEGWKVPELGDAEVLLEAWRPRNVREDPVRTCDRMLALFGGLRAHFASQQIATLECGAKQAVVDGHQDL